MKIRSSYAVLTRFGIIAAVLATLVLIAPAATAQSECELDGGTVKCTYVENGEDPVATFSATDEEGDPFTWSLKEEGDYKKFAISASGVLTFVSPPNFDSPGDDGGDNVYNITVVAGAGDRADGERPVEITVTDVNETGTVKFLGNQQPQVDRSMTAELSDEDGAVVRLSWQWQKSTDMDAADEDWEDVGTGVSYTPKLADVDSYLRAVVDYTDVEYDEPDTAMGVTKFKVRARPAANAAPTISAQTIEVFENSDGTIGSVQAKDDDELIYRLRGTDDPEVSTDSDGDDSNDNTDNDNARFTVTDSGELKLAAKLDFEQAAPEADETDLRSATDIDGTNDLDGDGTNDDTEDIVEYTVVVTAEDPSGAKGSGVIIVHLLNVDEAPAVTVESGATENEAEVVEAGTEPGETARTGQITPIAFTVAADPEGGTIDDDNSEGGWTLEGPDAAKFDFDSTDATQILFKGAASGDDGFFRPNFEDKKDANGDNVYEVTVVVPVTDSVKPGKRAVKVKVTDAEDTGTLKIAAREPQVGATVSGSLSDEDGGERDRVWQWYRGGNNDTTADEMTTLVGTLTGDTRPGICGADGVGAPGQTAACAIDKATSPSYTTVGADGGFHVHLVVDYTDAFDSDDTDGTDTATLSATPTRAVQAPPTINTAPKFGLQDREIDGDGDAPESVTRTVKEGNKPVADFTANDSDLLTFKLGGDDGGMFKLSDPSGEENGVSLSFADAPDFENPADADGDNSYEASITATDPSGSTDTLMVTVVVEDVDDKPVVSFAGDEMCEKGGTVKCTYAENGEGSVATFSVADDENDPTTWALKEADDYKKFEISADGVLTFKSSPDFDSAGDGDEDNVYKVTVVADAGDRADGEKAVEVTVTDENETGTVKFVGNQQPQVGESMTAELSDEDGAVVRLSWQWQKSADKDAADEDWEDVSSTSASYTPNADDVDSYLRAVVGYTDVEYDEPDTAMGVTKFTVRARPSANAPPSISARTIEVFEGVDGTIGSVAAKDDDELIYRLKGADDPDVSTDSDGDGTNDNTDNDNDRFTVTDSGELKLAAKLDYEQADTDTASDTNVTTTADIVEYTVVVTAEDPSGATGSGVIIVHLLNVDEAPAVTSSATDDAAEVVEAGTEPGETARTGQITAITFTVAADADPEGGAINTGNTATGGPDSSDTLRWMLEGPDADKFALDGTSLTFKGAEADDDKFRPNFEDKKDANGDNVYEVTVVVPVADSIKPGEKTVKITVTDAEDTGTLKIAAREPQVGASVSGSLSDEDGGERDRVWQWYRGGDNTTSAADMTTLVGTLTGAVADRPANCSADLAPTATIACKIDKATSPNYTTVGADGGWHVHLVVDYTDAFDSDDTDGTDTATLSATPTRAVQTPPTINEAPKFGIQDREIDGDDDAPESVMRTVKEGNKPVADFTANDDDLLTFRVGGDDGGMFKLSDPSGEDNTVSLSFADAPDFENPADSDGDNSYEASITATDPSGATDTLMVTVMVEDVDDKPTIELVTGAAPAPDSECVTGGAVADASNGGLTSDCEILLAGMDELVGDGTALNWSADTPIVEWQGVSSEQGEGRVVSIYLKGHGLAGSIPAGFNGLDALTKLQLHSNDLTGEIPDLSDLDNLIWLILQNNSLSGSLPMTLGDMDSLDFLYLRDNDLSGDIPTELTHATDLRRVDLRDNALTGTIPTEFGHMTRLRYLMLSDNDLSGMIPADLGSSPNMVLLYLSDNGLTGSIPAELGNISGLRRLQLHDNMLDGDVPAELGNLSELRNLTLSGNMLTGCIPAAIYGALADAADTGLMACPDDES